MRKFIIGTLAAAGMAASTAALAAGGDQQITDVDWSWEGIFGTYDHAQLRRGFQVYREICGNCHSMNLIYYRNLQQIGLTEDQVKEVAAEKEVEDGPNDDGEMFMRPALPSDHFVPPFPNDQAARVANNGALPPDLSLMTKARLKGPDYVYSLMTGYQDPPEGVEVAEGMNYNVAFPGHQIAMAPQIFDEMVTYEDGTQATADQITKDVVAFLNWAAEPELEQRKSMGLKTMLFLIVLTAMFFALKRRIWAAVH